MIESSETIVAEDADFLSLVAAAEAEMMSAKRRKILVDSPKSVDVPAKRGYEEEGMYIAALRGSKSLLFQKKSATPFGSLQNDGSKAVVKSKEAGFFIDAQSGGGISGNGNACFKCGGSGHWARDCSAIAVGGIDSAVPEKPCHCGSGVCLVLTANTEKNRGRKFYKCPLREENGGCGFFEWCDNSCGSENMTSWRQTYTASPSFPDLACPCGAGSCLVLAAKTGKSIGQQFYRCPANKESSCGFFKWCNSIVAGNLPVNTFKVDKNTNDINASNSGLKSDSSCFRCGHSGHWAKGCPLVSSPSIDVGVRSANSSGTCYKCGQLGHWAADCSSLSLKMQQRL